MNPALRKRVSFVPLLTWLICSKQKSIDFERKFCGCNFQLKYSEVTSPNLLGSCLLEVMSDVEECNHLTEVHL